MMNRRQFVAASGAGVVIPAILEAQPVVRDHQDLVLDAIARESVTTYKRYRADNNVHPDHLRHLASLGRVIDATADMHDLKRHLRAHQYTEINPEHAMRHTAQHLAQHGIHVDAAQLLFSHQQLTAQLTNPDHIVKVFQHQLNTGDVFKSTAVGLDATADHVAKLFPAKGPAPNGPVVRLVQMPDSPYAGPSQCHDLSEWAWFFSANATFWGGVLLFTGPVIEISALIVYYGVVVVTINGYKLYLGC